MVIGYDDKGLPKTKNVLAKTKAECEKKLKALLSQTKESESQTPQQKMTVAQWLDFWYQTYKKPNLRPNTQMSYERRIYQHIIPNLGPIPLNKLTTGDIQQFYAALKQSGRLLRQEQYGEGLFRPNRPWHPHHLPCGAGQSGLREDHPKKPLRLLPSPFRQGQRNAGADPGGDPAAAHPGQGGWML